MFNLSCLKLLLDYYKLTFLLRIKLRFNNRGADHKPLHLPFKFLCFIHGGLGRGVVIKNMENRPAEKSP